MGMTRPNETATMITEEGLEREWLLFEVMGNIDVQLKKRKIDR